MITQFITELSITIFNLDGNHPLWGNNVQMSPKPMRIVSQSDEKIVLRGYLCEAMSPFGWVDFDGSDYGLSIFLKSGGIAKCILHMHDRNVDIEYYDGEHHQIVQEQEYDYSDLPFYVLKQDAYQIFIENAVMCKIFEEEVSGSDEMSILSPLWGLSQRKTGRFHFVVHVRVTEKIVGISENDYEVYQIPWELLREVEHKGKKFLVFCGWGDPMSTGIRLGLPQFNYYEIGIEKSLFAAFIAKVMSQDKDFYSIEKMRNVIGLEGFKFENNKIYF